MPKETVLNVLIDQFEKLTILGMRYNALDSPKGYEYELRAIRVAALIEIEANGADVEMPPTILDSYRESLVSYHGLKGWDPPEILALQSLDHHAIKKIRRLRGSS